MDQSLLFTIVSLLLGLVLLFFGLKLAKIAVAILGFLFGYALASNFGMVYAWDPTQTLIAAVALGVLLALVAFSFYRIAVGISIALFCANFIYSLVLSSGVDPTVSLIVGLVTAVAAFIVVQIGRVVDILFAIATSLQGAALVIASSIVLLGGAAVNSLQSNTMAIILQAQGWWSLGWIVLSLVGIAFQIRSLRLRNRSEAATHPTE